MSPSIAFVIFLWLVFYLYAYAVDYLEFISVNTDFITFQITTQFSQNQFFSK
jgi:hypothetical protein